ncbi:MAG: stage III sporulation protein AG [Clostridium sp.]|nr:stage III sporulation protein AG [Clostridium sp.]
MREKGITQKLATKFTRDNFLIIILAGVLLLVIVWPVEEKNEKSSDKSVQWDSESDRIGLQTDSAASGEGGSYSGDGNISSGDYAARLEQSLERILSTMDGVGKVKVMVTLKDSGEAVVEKDVSKTRDGITEVDAAGGSRNTTNITDSEQTRYQNGEGSGGVPYVKQVLTPRVEGVAVSAEGGGNAQTVRNITEAIQALFGIEAHKIKIVKMISQ